MDYQHLVQQIIELLQGNQGMGMTGGKPNPMGGLLPQNSAPGQASAIATGASPVQKPPALQGPAPIVAASMASGRQPAVDSKFMAGLNG